MFSQFFRYFQHNSNYHNNTLLNKNITLTKQLCYASPIMLMRVMAPKIHKARRIAAFTIFSECINAVFHQLPYFTYIFQHNSTQHNYTQLKKCYTHQRVMQYITHYAVCPYSKCHYTQCFGAKIHLTMILVPFTIFSKFKRQQLTILHTYQT